MIATTRRRPTVLAWLGLAALQLALLGAATIASNRMDGTGAGAGAPARWQYASEWLETHGRLVASPNSDRRHAPTPFALPSRIRFADHADVALLRPRSEDVVVDVAAQELPPSRAPPARS